MKSLLLSTLVFVIACNINSVKDDSIKDFISGTYVKPIKSEFSSGNDTIIITSISSEGNNYRVTRHSSYCRIKNGKALPPERKTIARIAIYKPDEKVLQQTVDGSILSFNPAENLLYVNSSKYSKVVK